jgi:O-antigen/teichoic acid export membrane protein
MPALLAYEMKYSISGLVAISVLRYGWLIVLLKRHSLFTFSLKFIKEHIYLAFPLIISTLLGSSAQYVDGFLVLNKFDTTTFAIFKYGAKEFPLVLLMANALSTAMIPQFSLKTNFEDALIRLKKKSANLMHLLFPVTILFLLISSWLYPLVFNENFIESAKIFNIYLLLIISRLVFPHTILIGLRKTKIVMYASFAELVVNVILSVIFIQLWGIEGIAFATIIAYALQKVIWLLYNKYVLKIPVASYVPIIEWVIYSVITTCVFLLVF